jgi:hypothetical protein
MGGILPRHSLNLLSGVTGADRFFLIILLFFFLGTYYNVHHPLPSVSFTMGRVRAPFLVFLMPCSAF